MPDGLGDRTQYQIIAPTVHQVNNATLGKEYRLAGTGTTIEDLRARCVCKVRQVNLVKDVLLYFNLLRFSPQR
jgi:hypothetical protein